MLQSPQDGEVRSTDLIQSALFLVGCERSGTTLFRLMLDHHPQIAFFFEFEYAVSEMPRNGGFPDLQAYYDFLERNRIFRTARVEIDRTLDYPHLIDSFLRQKRIRDGNKPVVGATVHYAFDRLPRIWPDARFIHLLRDGRDVARSIIGMGWASNMYTAARWWRDAEETWSALDRQIPAERKLTVRYEDLVTRTQEELERVCEFIGVPYDPAMLDYSKTSTYEKPNTASLRQWKVKATPHEIQLAEAGIGQLLEARGYELSGLPPLTITPLREAWLNLHDRLGRFRFGVRRYGLRLVLAERVARWLRLSSWHKKIARRVDEIDEKYIK